MTFVMFFNKPESRNPDVTNGRSVPDLPYKGWENVSFSFDIGSDTN